MSDRKRRINPECGINGTVNKSGIASGDDMKCRGAQCELVAGRTAVVGTAFGGPLCKESLREMRTARGSPCNTYEFRYPVLYWTPLYQMNN